MCLWSVGFVVQKFLELHPMIPPSLFQYTMCIRVCSVHVLGMCVRVCAYMCSFFFPYCIQYCWYLCTLAAVRRNCISVNCRGLFVWNQKKSKMRSFYENVKWRHFRPSAIKDWRHPVAMVMFLFLFQSVTVVDAFVCLFVCHQDHNYWMDCCDPKWWAENTNNESMTKQLMKCPEH